MNSNWQPHNLFLCLFGSKEGNSSISFKWKTIMMHIRRHVFRGVLLLADLHWRSMQLDPFQRVSNVNNYRDAYYYGYITQHISNLLMLFIGKTTAWLGLFRNVITIKKKPETGEERGSDKEREGRRAMKFPCGGARELEWAGQTVEQTAAKISVWTTCGSIVLTECKPCCFVLPKILTIHLLLLAMVLLR